MRIKAANQNSVIVSTSKRIWRNRAYALTSLAIYTIAIFALGVYLHRSGFLYEKVMPAVRQNVKLIPNLIAGLQADPTQIMIDIKHTDFQKLAYQREVALRSGVLLKTDDDYVPAQIRLNDEVVKVKLRLKGDWTDHLQGDKWSYRVVVKGEKSIFGMKTFSIQHPKTRNYMSEWLFHRLLKYEGLIALRYDFIKAIINGKDLGVFALEEHFEKRLIEHNELREGPIIKFNENLLWLEKVQQRIPFPQAASNGAGLYLSSDIDGFQTNKWLADSSRAALYSRAIQLLETFRRGELSTSEVFDVPKLAKFFAVVDLVGGKHAAIWHNFRFYYNPVTAKLEPIGFDADCGYPITYLLGTKPAGIDDEPSAHGYTDYNALFFKDEAFYRAYIHTLERIADPAYLDTFFAEIGGDFEKELNIIYSEFPYYESPKEVILSNQRYIQTALNPVKGLHAYFHKHDPASHTVTVDVGAIQSLPIEVLGLSYKDSLSFAGTSKTELPPHYEFDLVHYQNASFALPNDFAWADSVVRDLKVQYKLVGTEDVRTEMLFPFPLHGADIANGDVLRQPGNAEQFHFLRIDAVEKTISIAPGNWHITRNLIIPKGYRLVAGPGVRVDLSNDAMILSHSPVEFVGTPDDPVVVQSSDSTGQGMVVMNAGARSVLQYVRFDNLSNPSQNGWVLTGAVTLYESPVDILQSEFVNNRCEDGLNIVRSDFIIDGSLFSGTQSDAFDSDFSDGKIVDTRFYNCGNDGIDISGSMLRVQNVLVDGAGDKGLSAGENSQMHVINSEIQNAEIAVSSKDLSSMTIDGIIIANSTIGFSPFQKKAEFGAAHIVVTNLELSNTEIPYLVEENSTLKVDDQEIPPSRKNVKEILYGVEFGKSSR